MARLEDETAIVTGATGGIGRGIARRFAAEGADVVVTSRSAERADEAAAELADETDAEVLGVEADVTDEAAMSALVDTTVERFGDLDVFVNNAGVTTLGPAESFDLGDWRQVIEVNLVGTFLGCQVAGRRMIEGDGGAILNVSSLMSSRGLELRSPYCASKGGVNNLTRTLAVEWAPHDVHVNALAPGFVWTDITDQTQDSAGYSDDDVRERTPLGRFGSIEEMAECALFLVGRNNYVTGEVLYADGGWKASGWGTPVRE